MGLELGGSIYSKKRVNISFFAGHGSKKDVGQNALKDYPSNPMKLRVPSRKHFVLPSSSYLFPGVKNVPAIYSFRVERKKERERDREREREREREKEKAKKDIKREKKNVLHLERSVHVDLHCADLLFSKGGFSFSSLLRLGGERGES